MRFSEFIGVKSHKARGKRLTNYEVENIKELEPVVKDEDDKPGVTEDQNKEEVDDVPFEINRPEDDEDKNQMSLF